MPSTPTIMASVTMKGCSRPLVMMTPLSAAERQADRGTTTSTPTTPNLSGTCAAASHQAAAPAASPARPATRARRAGRHRRSGRAGRAGRRAGTSPRPAARRTNDRQDREGQDGRAGQPVHGEQHGAEHRAQRHDRADRQVDAAGQDDQRHADRDDAVVRHLPQHVGQVAGAEEDVDALRVDRGRDDARPRAGSGRPQ